MDLTSIFIANGIGIFVLILLLYVSRADIYHRRAEDKLFAFMVVGVMFGCSMESLSWAVDGQPFAWAKVLNYLANTYLFVFNVVLPYCVLAYIDLVLYGDPKRLWGKYKVQTMVVGVMVAASLASLVVPISYTISENNVYSRLPFGYAYYAVILYLLVSAIITTHRYEKANGAKTFLRIPAFVVPILLGTSLQFAFYGVSLAWVSSAVGLAGFFMMKQNELAYNDFLVDAYNRQYLDLVLSSWVDQDKSFAGVMLDLDRFKSINDEFGHSEGDNALKEISRILKKSRRAGEQVFRFAGDEFIVVRLCDSAGGLDAYMDRVEENLAKRNAEGRPYEIGISYGTSFFSAGAGSIDAFMKEMDEKMYEMKASHHLRKRG